MFSSPVITSKKCTLLNIIGPDCFKIIENYQINMEGFEQNFNNIDECIKIKNNSQNYVMTTFNLDDFRNYCVKKKYNINIKFKIIIDDVLNTCSFNINKLKKMYLKYLKIKSIKYVSKNSANYIEINLGKHSTKDFKIFDKVIYEEIFKCNIDIDTSNFHNFFGEYFSLD